MSCAVPQLPAGAVLPAGRDRRGPGQHQHRQGRLLHPLQEGLSADHRHLAQGGVLRVRRCAGRHLLGGTCAGVPGREDHGLQQCDLMFACPQPADCLVSDVITLSLENYAD